MYGWAHQPPVTKPCSGSGHWPGAVVPPMLTHGADARARWRTLGSGDPPRTLRKDDDINRSTIGESVGPVSAAPPALTPKLVPDTLAARDTACATIATRYSKDDLQRVFDTINADGSAPPCGCGALPVEVSLDPYEAQLYDNLFVVSFCASCLQLREDEI